MIVEETSRNLIKLAIDDIYGKVKNKIDQAISNRILEHIIETAGRCAQLRTILHKENVLLDKIYLPLSLKSGSNQIKSEFVGNLFKGKKRIIIEGQGGSGKTTLIKYIFLNCVKTNFKIPLLINFRDFNLTDVGKTPYRKGEQNIFYNEIVSHLLFSKIGINEETIAKLFDSGKIIFILDGFDELNYNIKTTLLRDLDEFISRFNKNLYIITSRPYTEIQTLSNFTSYEICGLNNIEEIHEFIKKQLFLNPELASAIIESLTAPETTKYLPLLSNPLFLILFINCFESYPKLPPKKSTFYWQVFDALFEKHETYSKSGFRRPKLSNLRREDFEAILNAFSFASYFKGNFSFDAMQMESILREYRKISVVNFEINDFIQDLKVTLSLLVEDGNRYSFLHRTLQEYFAARFLSSFDEKDKAKTLEKIGRKQAREGSHEFIIELISELYPSEFSQFYIPSHIKEFMEVHKFTLTNEHPDLSATIRLYSDFESFFRILSFSPIASSLFDKFYNQHKNSLSISHLLTRAAEWPNGKKALVVQRHLDEYLMTIREHYNNIQKTNQPFINFSMFQ